MIAPRFTKWKTRSLALILFVASGLALAPHYGQSWDEQGDLEYGRDSLRAYLGSTDFLHHADRIYYGPFFLMVSAACRAIVGWIRPNWPPTDVQHFLNFLTFGLASWSFYHLCRRVLPRSPAALTAMLFGTQPILFGHGFVNHKDVPFLAFFLLSVELGIRACDTWAASGAPQADEPQPGPRIAPALDAANLRLLLLGLLLVGIALFNVLLWLGEAILEQVYQGLGPPMLQRLFVLVAEDAHKTPLQAYLTKVLWIHFWLRAALFILGSAVLLVAEARIRGPRSIVRPLRQRRKALALAASALALGLATSIRVAAPLAGALVSFYWLARARRAAVGPIALYWGVAGTISYLTWPFLWPRPIDALQQAIRLMSHFRALPVLFDGRIFPSNDLPRHYLPRLMGMQLTEPMVALLGIGLLTLGVGIFRKKVKPEFALVVLLWAGVPFLAVVQLHMPVYDNFRQLLFALPPLFLVAGLGLGDIWKRLSGPVSRPLLALALLLPGAVGIVRLHPYEYTYYNSLTGGVKRAEGKYELDYWCTAYREAIMYLNRVAPSGAVVVVLGPDSAARPFARPDLDIRTDWEPVSKPDYVLACGHSLFSSGGYSDAPIVFEVRRGGALMAAVKRRSR